jgi:glycosyltransferase involved in cell wall biosynthesis
VDQRVIIVIPTHNEEDSIAAVIQELRQLVPDYDRVIVNDGSKDRTGEIVAGLGEKQLKLVHNLGYGQALQTGLKYALMHGYDIIVSMDADGQHQPKDVRRLVNALQEQDADVIIGSRFSGGNAYNTAIDRRLGQLLFSHLTRFLVGQRIYDTSSGFKAMRASACEVIVNSAFMDFHIESIVKLSHSRFKIAELPITVQERRSGRSMHSISSVFLYPLKTILLTVVAIMDVLLVRRTK